MNTPFKQAVLITILVKPMPFTTIIFVFGFLIYLFFSSFKQTYIKKVVLIALFNLFFYGNWTFLCTQGFQFDISKIVQLNGSLVYLVIWSILLYAVGRKPNFFKILAGFSILQLFFWKAVDAQYLSIDKVTTPLGLSFFTFQGLTYLFARVKFAKHLPHEQISAPWTFLELFAFTGFFPTVLSGPILRATAWKTQLIHSIESELRDGLVIKAFVYIGLGCLYKLCFASYLHDWVSLAFSSPKDEDFAVLLTGAVSYSFEIYFDFAGYSLIALGLMQLMGMSFGPNFNSPYSAKNIKEFWQRWHMSLSSWLKDYFYISILGGSKKGLYLQVLNAFLVMAVCGLWHGIAANYVVWGLLHATAIAVYSVYAARIKANFKNKSWVLNQGATLLTFLFVTFSWIFFRADSLSTATQYLEIILDISAWPGVWDSSAIFKITVLILIYLFLQIESILLQKLDLLANSQYTLNPLLLGLAVGLFGIVVLVLSPAGTPPFIYFSY